MREEVATLAGGCFWCLEAVFDQMKGVSSVESGYTGGQTERPTYESVCSGRTGHAEAVRISFDPDIVSYRELLQVFFVIHDPTTLNRQGHDVGTQYRSAIFPQNAEQEAKAREGIRRANVDHHASVVTTIEPMGEWYPAEDYHQDYWAGEGQRNPYCLATISPKLQKLRKSFQARVKSATAPA